jgi:hypothetical protein
LEGVYCKQAAASIVQPESKNSFEQPSMECTDDSTRGAKKDECIQFPLKLREMLDNADAEGFSEIVIQTTLLSNIDPLDRPVECDNDDQINQYADLGLSSSSVDSVTNLMEGVDYNKAAASAVQPSAESKNSFRQPSMVECTDDSTTGAKKECIQFPWKLHEMLDNADVEGFSDIVSWLPGSTNSFKVHQPAVFVESIMPRYFKKIQFKSFRRQINMWGFERIKGGAGKGGYRDPHFIRGMPSLCCMMKRVKIKGTGSPLLVASKRHPGVPSLLLETGQIPNYLNPCVLEKEKVKEDWCRIHESSLLQFARQVLRLPNSGSAEIFSSDDIAQELISTFSFENDVVVG